MNPVRGKEVDTDQGGSRPLGRSAFLVRMDAPISSWEVHLLTDLETAALGNYLVVVVEKSAWIQIHHVLGLEWIFVVVAGLADSSPTRR